MDQFLVHAQLPIVVLPGAAAASLGAAEVDSSDIPELKAAKA